mgnify:CR=1 FL=1|jgi:hypothetical protein
MYPAARKMCAYAYGSLLPFLMKKLEKHGFICTETALHE